MAPGAFLRAGAKRGATSYLLSSALAAPLSNITTELWVPSGREPRATGCRLGVSCLFGRMYFLVVLGGPWKIPSPIIKSFLYQ